MDDDFKIDPKVKLLRHFNRVQGIIEGDFLPPLMVDIDVYEGPCNIDCVWCSQAVTRKYKSTRTMPAETMKNLGPFSKKWGIKSWKIAGVSEPTLNSNIDILFRSGYEFGIDMGLTTNGIFLNKVQDLHLLTWLGISLDAATAETWSLMKNSPKKNFYRIINNIKSIRDKCPDLDISIKFCKWSKEINPLKNDFYPDLPPLEDKKQSQINQSNNYADTELLPQLAEDLGCNYILRDAFPTNFPGHYKFEKCLVTPLEGAFGADHRFHLCCDARNIYVLTDDYTRNDWQEVIELWGSKKHKDLIGSINPEKCLGCSKWKLCSVLENVILDGRYTKDYQVNFI